jgi:hypothetical protein
MTLWERGEAGLSLTNLLGSVVAGVVAVAPGVGLARAMHRPLPERTRPIVRPIRAREPGDLRHG